MTVASRPHDATAPFKSLLVRAAEALGWTPGQVWTVAIGLVLAVPAGIFGLAPALDDGPAQASAAFQAPAGGATAPDEAPAPGGDGPGPVTAPAPPALGAPTAFTPAADPGGTFFGPEAGGEAPPVTVPGEGAVQAIAVRGDGVVAAVDTGPGKPGRVLVLDASGGIVLDQSLEIGDQTFSHPGGVTVARDGVFVATASPAAILRLDVRARRLSKVADLPDVPVCLPLGATSDCQVAVPDAAPRPRHLVVTDRGDLYVADQGQACILRLAAGEAKATTWLCDVTFGTPPTAPEGGLRGLAWAPGQLVYTVGAGLDGSDRVQQVEIRDRAPGERRELAVLPGGAGATGVTVLADGRTVVALATTAHLLIVEDGSAWRTVALDGMTGPNDVDSIGDTLLVAHVADGSAGQVSRRATAAL